MPTGIGVSVSPVLSGSGESGGYTPPTSWILATGFWNDSGDWIDTDNWIDGADAFSLQFQTQTNSQYIPLIT